MRHKRYLMLIYFVSCILLFVPYNVFGHPGRTDSHGGHYDHNTGTYHYHHGKPAHLHPNGICPYMPTQSEDVVSSETSAPPAESLSYKETANSSPSKIEWTNNKNQLFGFKILVCVLSILIFLILYYLFKINKKHSLQLSVVCKEKEDIESEYTALKSTNWVQKINQMESEKNELIQTSNELRTEISALQQELKNTKDYLHSVEYEKLVKIHEIESLQLQIEVLRSTGARVGEIVEITVDQINWETGDILILGEKSNRYRTIYLDPDALYHYKKYWNSRTDNNEHMFVSKSKPYKPIGTSSVRTIMKEIAEHAGVTNRCYPHKMRKTLGMELKNRGVDIGTIQEVLGHADSKVTSMYYAQSTPDTLRMIRKRAV